MHDGSSLRLRKLEEDYDPTDKIRAITRLAQSQEADEVLTGVLYLNTTAPNFHRSVGHDRRTAGHAS